MQHQLLERVLLPVTHQHLLHLAIDVEINDRGEEPLVLGGEQDGVVLDLDAFGRLAGAVDDGRHEARMTQAAARTFPLVLAALRLDFMILGHFIYYLGGCLPPRGGLNGSPATRGTE